MLAYNKSLDGLRAIAVLMVLWSHSPIITGSSFSQLIVNIGDIIGVGYFGVDLFFVLSGYLITSILILEKQKTGTINFSFFYLKRTLRIFPIYYLTILFCYLVIGPVGNDILSAVTYTSNYYFVYDYTGGPLRHTWSLAVEEQFYLVWPLIVYKLSMQSLKRLCLIYIPVFVFLMAVLSLFFWDLELGKRMLYRGTPFRMLSLGLGSLIAIYAISGKVISKSNKLLVIFVAIGTLLSAFVCQNLGYSASESILKMFGFSFLSVGIVLNVVFGLPICNALCQRLLSTSLLGWIGQISYGLYLYHAVIFFYLGISKYQAESVDGLTFIIAILATFIFSWLSFHVFEKHITGLKYKLLRQKY